MTTSAVGGLEVRSEDLTPAIARAVTFLRTVLAAGPLPVSAVEEVARDEGITRRTLRRARAKLGVRSAPDGYQGQRMLALPEVAASLDHDATSDDPGIDGGARSDDHGEVRTDRASVPVVAGTDAPGDRDRRRPGSERPGARRVALRRIR